MAKKNDKNKPEIVEAPEVIIETSDGDVKTEEPSIEAPKEEKVLKLKVEIGFCDKYTKVDYKIGDIIEVEKERYNELLNDERKLVSEV